MRRGLRAVGALLLLLSLLAGCTSGDEPDTTASTPASSDLDQLDTQLQPCPEQTDQPAADGDLPATVFDCFGGGTLDLSRAPGVPTVVNLWASWCAPCREELPVVQQLADTAGDRLRVLGVASLDGASQTAAFASDAAVTFPSAFDGEGEVMAALGLNNLPYTLFLLPDGSLAHLQVGQITTLQEFQQLVADHLGVQL